MNRTFPCLLHSPKNCLAVSCKVQEQVDKGQLRYLLESEGLTGHETGLPRLDQVVHRLRDKYARTSAKKFKYV